MRGFKPKRASGANNYADGGVVSGIKRALGFDPEDLPTTMSAPDLGVTGWNTLKIDWKSMMTSLDGVFAAGDIVRGASLVVWAVRDGRDAAERIHTYLAGKALAAARIAAE